MTKSPIKVLAMAGIAAYAVLGNIGAGYAQMHDGSHAGGSGFHGGGESHGGGAHGGGPHRGGEIHHGGGFHGRTFVGPPIILGPGYYPYGDFYPYGYDWSSYQWYCPDPAGYYPDVQVCATGWLQVIPNG